MIPAARHRGMTCGLRARAMFANLMKDAAKPATPAGPEDLLRASAFQKKRGNGLSFLSEIAFGHVSTSLPIPVASIGKIALHAMQPGMDPGTFGTHIVLGDLMSGAPLPMQSVPYGPHQRGSRRQRSACPQTLKKGSDIGLHGWLFPAPAAGLAVDSLQRLQVCRSVPHCELPATHKSPAEHAICTMAR
jgi:hypothetical protein